MKAIPGLDTGSPPIAVIAEMKKRSASVASILGHVVPTGDLMIADQENQAPVPEPIPILPEPEIKIPAMPALPQARFTERVTLTSYPTEMAFALNFSVYEICEREYYISLLIASDMQFRPAGKMSFDLTYRGKTVPVIFIGAEFEFQSVAVRGISFLVDKNRNKKA
jgi:hypothetical protein